MWHLSFRIEDWTNLFIIVVHDVFFEQVSAGISHRKLSCRLIVRVPVNSMSVLVHRPNVSARVKTSNGLEYLISGCWSMEFLDVRFNLDDGFPIVSHRVQYVKA